MRRRSTYSSNNSGGTGGVCLPTVIQIVFIILKMLGLINWRWGIVLIPFWIELGVVALLALLWLFVVLFRKWRKKEAKHGTSKQI
jgi:hypothetical protein